jgi:hypothetical protein
MAETRVRRTSTKKIDYAKEQEFSDEDLFEDGEAAAAAAPNPTPSNARSAPVLKKRGRKSKIGATHVNFTSDNEVPKSSFYNDSLSTPVSNRIVYTEKGYDSTLPPIRDRFTFMPEYEDDGTMKIELIVGRRKVDEVAQEEANESEPEVGDDVSTLSNQPTEFDHSEGKAPKERKTVETDFNSSPTGRGKEKNAESEGLNPESTVESEHEYEYLVKYKGKSYLHLEWKSGADLESMNKSAKGLYRRYLKKLEQGYDDELENPEFDPSFAVPEKIIDEAEQDLYVELTDKELLRWEKQREKELAQEAVEWQKEEKDSLHDNISKESIDVSTEGDGIMNMPESIEDNQNGT